MRAWRIAAALLPAFLAACAGTGALPDPRTMTFSAPSFAPPRPARHVLANGLVVFLLPDRELPLVEGRAVVRAGAVLDPPGKTGLASLCGRLLVRGGTRELPGARLDEALEARAISMGGEMGSVTGSVTFSALTGDLDRALELFAGVLRRPAFDEERLETARARAVEEIRRSADDPDALAFREFRRFLYAGDPRGRAPAAEEVMGLTREDVDGFWRSHAHPDRVILGFTGDFEPRDLLSRLEELFGDWPPAGGPPPDFPVPRAEDSDRLLTLVDKDLDQATMALGHLAPPRTSDDHAPFMLANFILGGGGFSSRLMREIRSNRGLAYSVGSFYRGDIGYGVFAASCKTANETAPEALNLMLDLARRMREEGITPAELEWARESIINGMIFRYATPGEILAEAMSLEHDRLPPDFTERLKELIERATVGEVNDAARRWLDPDGATVVILGRAAPFAAGIPAGREVRRLRAAPDGRVE